MLDAGADVNAAGPAPLKTTALKAAARKGGHQIVERLLEAGAEVNQHSEWYCQTDRYQDFVQRLLEAGAEGSAPMDPHSDALHIAIAHEA